MKTCLNCGKDFPSRMKINGKIRTLHKRKYCIECSPFNKHNTKQLCQIETKQKRKFNCRICNRISKAKTCSTCVTKLRRHRCKMAAVKLLGGECSRCGWSGNIISFDFHHKDPSKKDFGIGKFGNRSWEVLKKEVLKCELLCANCHRVEHSNRHDSKFLKEVINYKGDIPI